MISENTSAIVGLVLDKTNFYAEQGGQIHDTGYACLVGQTKVRYLCKYLLRGVVVSCCCEFWLIISQASFRVTDVQSFGGYVLHIGQLDQDGTPLSVDDHIDLHVDRKRRATIMSNHTSTHMLNFALRSVIGDGVEQRGSLVDHHRFR